MSQPSQHDRRAPADLEAQAMAWPLPEPSPIERGSLLPGAPEPVSDAARGSSLRDVVETVLLTLLIAAGIQMAVQSRLVEGSSMEPTLHDGQRLLVNRLSYASLGEPQRGDVVIFQAWDQDEDYIKRVIGVPGDVIEISGGEIRVNGSVLDEPYLDGRIDHGHIGPLVLGPDDFYVMGDNRGNSSDSRLHGPLEREQLIGKAWLSYWPLENLGLISGPTSYAAER